MGVAFLICFITASSRVLLKKGLGSSNALTAMVYSLIIGWAALMALSVFTGAWAHWQTEGAIRFALIGIVAPPVVRYLTYKGVDLLGAARSDPIRSLTPFFAIAIAVTWGQEAVSLRIWCGSALILLGVVLLSQVDNDKKLPARKWTYGDLLFPLGAAAVAGAVANWRKWAMPFLHSPILGATIAASSAVVVFAIFLLLTGKWRELHWEKSSSRFFIVSGLATGITDVLDLVALSRGSVSLVSPLLATTPLFVILMSHVFLKGIEKITARLVAVALIILVGIELIVYPS